MPLSIKIALREWRAGMKGFYIALACLAVSSFTLTANNSMTQSLINQLQREGRTILGGDIEIRRIHLPFSAQEKTFLAAESQRLSFIARMRVMTQTLTQNTPAELKAVDAHWPLIGQARLEKKRFTDISDDISDDMGLAEALAHSPDADIYGAIAAPALLSALDIEVGDQFQIGEAKFQLRAILAQEPDGLADGLALAPRLIISRQALAATKLVQPASLITYQARILLPQESGAGNRFLTQLNSAFPQAAWQIRTHRDSSPSLRRAIERIAIFLTLAALTTFLVSGIGIANAVSTWFLSKRPIIATLKCLGAKSGVITRAYLLQIMMMACLGIAIGIALGIAAPFVLVPLFSALSPLPIEAEFNLTSIWRAIFYGLLISALFSLIPLARAKATPPSHLFRAHIAPITWRRAHSAIGRLWWAAIIALAAAIFLITLLFAREQAFAIYFLLGASASLALLYLVGSLLIYALGRLPKRRNLLWRIAIANVIRPGAQSRNVIMALGLGLALLSAIALVDGNLRYQIEQSLPDRAPDFFIADIRADQITALNELLNRDPAISKARIVPLLRGRIVKIKNRDPDSFDLPEEQAWMLRGDRGLTYASQPPETADIVKGKWWAETYQGAPLLSLSEEAATAIGLDIGDQLTVNLLGVPITATIHNIRKINWNRAGMNFVLIFSPAPFNQIPANHFATIHVADHAIKAVRQKLVQQFPNMLVIETGEVLNAVNQLMQQIVIVARAASFWTLLAGVLVLAAAIAASFHQKLAEAVIFKVLGAARPLIAKTAMAEYALLGLAAAIAALIIGTAGAWTVITFLWDAEWVFLPQILFLTIIGAVLTSIACGTAINHRALAQKPAPWLRRFSQ